MALWPKKAAVPPKIAMPDKGGLPVTALQVPRLKRAKKTKPEKLKVASAVKQRFEAYIDKKHSGCWRWKGSRTADGYGQFWLNERKVVKAHRFAFELYSRQLGKKERLRRICKDKKCINPECWEAFTIGVRATKAKPKTGRGR